MTTTAATPVLPARTLADLDARSTSAYARPDPSGEVVAAPSSFVLVRPGGGGRPPVAIGDLDLTHLGWRYTPRGDISSRRFHDGPSLACKLREPQATDLVLTRGEAMALGLARPRQA